MRARQGFTKIKDFALADLEIVRLPGKADNPHRAPQAINNDAGVRYAEPN